MKRKFTYFCLFTILLFCTCKNPFGGDEITGVRTKITGKVSVPGDVKLAGVYVWLEQINVGVFTDENGEFALRLPTKAASPEIEGLSGAFYLYFFTINFRLDTAKVLIRDGEFEYGKADIDQNGRLRKDIMLSKMFHVVSEVSVSEIFKYGKLDTIINVRTTVSSATGTVTIIIPNGTEKLLGAICLRNLNTGEIQLSASANPLNRIYKFLIPVTTSGMVLEYFMKIQDVKRKNDKYTVIPYIMSTASVPVELYRSIGFDPDYFDTTFTKILFDHKATVFTILQRF